MHVQKGDSRPIDPEKASFLTTFPAEIRNSIYELLFQKDQPVLLHNAEAYHPEEPSPLQWPSIEDYSNHMKRYWETYEEDACLDEEFRHNLGDGLGLLLSCRQLYHEAADVLYGQNTFIISRAVSRHDETQKFGPSRHDSQAYFPMVHAARWLSSLGSQAELLHKVIIDTDALCPLHCACSMREYNILPLARFLWTNPSVRTAVTFGQSGRVLDHTRFQPPDLPEEEISTVYRTNVLNNLLAVFIDEDPLNLRRFHKSDRLLKSIEIPNARARGFVRFYNPDPPIFPHIQGYRFTLSCFEVSSQGKHVEWAPRKPPKLTDMPPHIMLRIYRFACYNPDGITFDLDTRTAHGLDINLFHWSRFVLTNAELANTVPAVNRVTIKATSNSLTTSFNDFEALDNLLYRPWENPERGIFQNMMSQTHTAQHPLTLSLAIHAPHPASLSDIRINIAALLNLLYEYKFHPNATLSITLTCTSGWQARTTTPIAPLQRSLFLHLSDVLSGLRSLPVSKRPRALGQEWQLWIDGHGNLLHVAFPGAALTYPFRHGHLSAAEVRVVGAQRSVALMNKRTYGLYPAEVLEAWKGLRDLHWPEWEERLVGLKGLEPVWENQVDDLNEVGVGL